MGSLGHGTLPPQLGDLATRFRGALLRPTDQGYDQARRVWNARVDRRPRLIAQCVDSADVVTAVNVARDSGVRFSVRSTGHNVSGCAVLDDGLMIDLSGLKDVRVDARRRRAVAGAGVLWGELDHETQRFGLATTGGRISTTGVAGLTLGGGFGWLMRKVGLAVDNLRAAEIVTADGKLRTVDATRDGDLFWGLRGGGGNFGVVTAFEYDLHRIGPMVAAGAAFYRITGADQVMRWYRRLAQSAPDDLSAQCNFLIAPSAPFVPPAVRGVPVIAIAVCHTGSAEAAGRDLACRQELGEPLLDRIGSMPYARMQRLYDAAGRFGFQVHSRSGFLRELSDDAIGIILQYGTRIVSPHSIFMLTPLGGAVGRFHEHATAFPHRKAAFNFAIEAVWSNPADSTTCVQWVEEFWAALRQHSAGVYVNELGDEGADRVREAYSDHTYARLVQLKRRFDPGNLFCGNQNIVP